jgi:hypothetical protein
LPLGFEVWIFIEVGVTTEGITLEGIIDGFFIKLEWLNR